MIKLLPYFLFENIFTFQRWKWPAQGTGTVPTVSAHFRSVQYGSLEVRGRARLIRSYSSGGADVHPHLMCNSLDRGDSPHLTLDPTSATTPPVTTAFTTSTATHRRSLNRIHQVAPIYALMHGSLGSFHASLPGADACHHTAAI